MCACTRVLRAPPKAKNEWIHSRQLYPSLLLCRSIFQLQLCFVVSLSLSVFASSAAFFAIKAQRNQSVTVSSETGKESKSVWKRCSQDDDKRDGDASAVWQPCCRKHFARIGPVAEVNQPKWSQRVTKHSTGVVWFHSAKTAEWFVLWPFCLCWRTQPFYWNTQTSFSHTTLDREFKTSCKEKQSWRLATAFALLVLFMIMTVLFTDHVWARKARGNWGFNSLRHFTRSNQDD